MLIIYSVNSKRVGNISELRVIARLLELDNSVSVPYGDNNRYDLLVEANRKTFKRVQVKTARRPPRFPDIIKFSCASVNSVTQEKRSYTNQEIDCFMVYWPEKDKVYEIPVDMAPTNEMTLRIDMPKNNNKKLINWARDYEL